MALSSLALAQNPEPLRLPIAQNLTLKIWAPFNGNANGAVKNFAEMYHDAITQRDEMLTLERDFGADPLREHLQLGLVAVFSGVVNALQLTVSLYMMQVYDRVVPRGVETVQRDVRDRRKLHEREGNRSARRGLGCFHLRGRKD